MTSYGFEENWQRRGEVEPQVEEVPDRTEFITVLIEVENEGLRKNLKEAQNQIEEFKCVDLVPDDYFHITVKLGGFLVDNPSEEDELGEEDLNDIVNQAEEIVANQDTFEVEVKNLNIFPTVVFAESHDKNGELQSLHEEFSKIEQLMDSPHGYIPHTTLCHFQSQEEFDELLDKLEEIREQNFGTFEVEEISLVRDDIEAYADLEGERSFEIIERFEL